MSSYTTSRRKPAGIGSETANQPESTACPNPQASAPNHTDAARGNSAATADVQGRSVATATGGDRCSKITVELDGHARIVMDFERQQSPIPQPVSPPPNPSRLSEALPYHERGNSSGNLKRAHHKGLNVPSYPMWAARRLFPMARRRRGKRSWWWTTIR